MEIGEIITTVATALLSGGLGSIIGWRAKQRQENADAAKAEAAAKGDQIENIEKLMDKAYSPIIEGLTKQVQSLQAKVEKLEAEKDEKDQRIDELEHEVRLLRNALRGVCPESIPSRRGENGKNAQRNPDGTFAKKEDA